MFNSLTSLNSPVSVFHSDHWAGSSRSQRNLQRHGICWSHIHSSGPSSRGNLWSVIELQADWPLRKKCYRPVTGKICRHSEVLFKSYNCDLICMAIYSYIFYLGFQGWTVKPQKPALLQSLDFKVAMLWHGWVFYDMFLTGLCGSHRQGNRHIQGDRHMPMFADQWRETPEFWVKHANYPTPLNNFTRFLLGHPDFVCAFCSCCGTGSGDCWSEGQSKRCYGDLSKQIRCYRVMLQAFWGCVHFCVTCNYGHCMQNNARDTQSIPEARRGQGLHIGEMWIAQQQTINNGLTSNERICTRWQQQHEAMPRELPQRLSMSPGDGVIGVFPKLGGKPEKPQIIHVRVGTIINF